MAQKQHRKQENERTPTRDGRRDIERLSNAGEILKPRRWALASLVIAGLLCVSALSQLPDTTDVPRHSVKRGARGKNGSRHRRRGGPKLAGVRPGGDSVQLNPPRKEGVKPVAQATANSNNEPTATEEAQSTLTGDTGTAKTRPREATQSNSVAAPPPNTNNLTDANVVKSLSAPAEEKTVRDDPVRSPVLEAEPLFHGVLPKVNPISLIADTNNRAFVETFKNPKAHKIIVKELGSYPKLKLVATREEADFIISYTDKKGFELQPGSSTSPGSPVVPVPVGKLIGEMVVYKLGAKQEGGLDQRDVVWTESEDQDKVWMLVPDGRHPATNLTRHFLRDLKKLRGEIK